MEKIKIANSRGKKPVINDICRCLRILLVNEFEMNQCELKKLIATFRSDAAKILIADDQNIKIYK